MNSKSNSKDVLSAIISSLSVAGERKLSSIRRAMAYAVLQATMQHGEKRHLIGQYTLLGFAGHGLSERSAKWFFSDVISSRNVSAEELQTIETVVKLCLDDSEFPRTEKDIEEVYLAMEFAGVPQSSILQTIIKTIESPKKFIIPILK